MQFVQIPQNVAIRRASDQDPIVANGASAGGSAIESEDTPREEFQSAKEEILSANEELQSKTKELEISKEELQSSNEELGTLNAELRNASEAC